MKIEEFEACEIIDSLIKGMTKEEKVHTLFKITDSLEKGTITRGEGHSFQKLKWEEKYKDDTYYFSLMYQYTQPGKKETRRFNELFSEFTNRIKKATKLQDKQEFRP